MDTQCPQCPRCVSKGYDGTNVGRTRENHLMRDADKAFACYDCETLFDACVSSVADVSRLKASAHYRFPCGGGSTPVCLACVPEVLRAEGATLEDLGGVLHDVAFPGDFCEVCDVSLAPLAPRPQPETRA